MNARTTVGHPVDVATGAVYCSREDISLNGKVRLSWERRYTTARLERTNLSLGNGWNCRYFASLSSAENQYRFTMPEGASIIFADPDGAIERGGVLRDLGTCQELRRRDSRYVITRWYPETNKIECYVFTSTRSGFQLTAIEDETGQGLDLGWDGERLRRIKQRLEKRTIWINYDSRGFVNQLLVSALSGEAFSLVRYEHDSNGRLIAAYDALGNADRYEYGSSGCLTREFTKTDAVFDFEYDDRARCVRTTGRNSYDEKILSYRDQIGCTHVTNSFGKVTLYRWNGLGQVICEVSPLGAVRQIGYDEHGRIVKKTDPAGGIYEYAYDNMGNRCSIKNPVGAETHIKFNEHHLPELITDPAGKEWRRTYDDRMQLVQTIDPLGGRWRYDYDVDGNFVRMIDPLGAEKVLSWAENGVLLYSTDWAGNVTSYKTDELGRITERIVPSGKTKRITYDLLSNPLSVEFADGSRVTATYDAAGHPATITDALGRTTKYRFGTCGRLLERIDPAGNTTKYKWATEPAVLEFVKNPRGELYTFAYDDDLRPIKEHAFDGSVWRYKYDPAGRCIAKENGIGEVVFYEHDLAGQVTSQSIPGTKTTHFAYDALGSVKHANVGGREISYERDALGRPVRELQGKCTLERTYDALGRVLSITTSLGFSAEYAYDPNGRTIGIIINGDHSLRWQRDADGKELRRKLPGELTIARSYDQMGQLVGQKVDTSRRSIVSSQTPAGVPARSLVERQYEYDAAGYPVAVTENRHDRVVYAHDSAGRVTSVRGPNAAEGFTYDETGNVALESRDDNLIRFEYDPGDQLVAHGDVRFMHDACGRVIRKVERTADRTRIWEFHWNALDQLESAVMPDGKIWFYEYDAFGRRTCKRSDDRHQEFFWDNEVVLHTSDANFSTTSTAITDSRTFEPLLWVDPANHVRSIVADQLGRPREVFNARGHLVWQAKYSTWGRAETESYDGWDCPLRFAGQWHDAETGLYYNRFRYYDPESARYLTPDPIHLRGGINLRTYVHNPLLWVDPFGLGEEDCRARAEEERDKKVQELTERGETPAAVVGAYDPTTGKVAVGVSGSIPPPAEVAPPLLAKADELGGLGAKTTAAGPVGNCAEFDAANQLIQQGSKPEDIRFTDAIRPRTGQTVPPCSNCKQMFGL